MSTTGKGSSGSPILNLEKNKLIGLHKGTIRKNDLGIGILISYPINAFAIENIKKFWII